MCDLGAYEMNLNELFPRASKSFLKANAPLQNPFVKPHPTTTLGTVAKRKDESYERPHVRFTLCRVSLLDVDAKWGSIKDLLDGMQIAGLIPGDREGEITLAVYQQKVFHRSDECTEIEIVYGDGYWS